jgi:hypothetical protein
MSTSTVRGQVGIVDSRDCNMLVDEGEESGVRVTGKKFVDLHRDTGVVERIYW